MPSTAPGIFSSDFGNLDFDQVTNTTLKANKRKGGKQGGTVRSEDGQSIRSARGRKIQKRDNITSTESSDSISVPPEDEDDDEVFHIEDLLLCSAMPKREKAVKLKKIFVRILKKVLRLPANTPLLRVYRPSRVARCSQKKIPAGWYGVEVMDVAEVDNMIQKLAPELNPQTVGNSNPLELVAGLIGHPEEKASEFIEMRANRYRLNEGTLSRQSQEKMKSLRVRAKKLHEDAVMNFERQRTAESTGGVEVSCPPRNGNT
ncbi:hypothetical protein CYMTET_25329 [Cymbomonas tetramitiformis]|uniref:Uncharacterized protein n=1 Tax=Cymbomonas tetramitiformis TaxID=36881 RepID=A0AAE0FUN8_9CHLO|nr:hypothetical protein CYMTET_25329 [Cymbomonas tetramitiformis]